MRDQQGKNNHNFKHGLTGSKFYSCFQRLKSDCNNPKSKKYYLYGGRGIKNKWLSFIDFKNDMYSSYISHVEKFGEKQTQIDRINPNSHYCKTNCRWANLSEQSKNRRGIKLYLFKGKKRTLFEISKLKGLSKNALYERISKGWTVDNILKK